MFLQKLVFVYSLIQSQKRGCYLTGVELYVRYFKANHRIFFVGTLGTQQKQIDNRLVAQINLCYKLTEIIILIYKIYSLRIFSRKFTNKYFWYFCNPIICNQSCACTISLLHEISDA